jgi:hypothetical protein
MVKDLLLTVQCLQGTYNLSKLRNLPVDHPELVFERDAIIASFEAQSELAPFSYREMLDNGKTKTFHRVAIGFFMQAAQQLSGINLVSTYANKILQESFGLTASTSHLVAAMGGLEYALCSLLSVLLIEGLGRRRAFLWTTVGMSCCFAVIAGLQSTDSRTSQLVAAGFLFLFNSFFGLAWVGGPFLYSAEIAPLRCRAQANAFASAGNWLCCFVVVMIIPPAFQNIGWKTVSLPSLCIVGGWSSNVPLVYHFCHSECLLRTHHLLFPCRNKTEKSRGACGYHRRRENESSACHEETQSANILAFPGCHLRCGW